MRSLPLILTASSALLAACGDDGGGGKAQDAAPQDSITIFDSPPADAPPVDADPSLDFSCYQNTAPTTAPANLSIAGTTQTFSTGGGSPIADVMMKACTGDCTGNNLLASFNSGTDGAFTTGDLATGGAPLDSYLIATKPSDDPDTNYLKTFLFPATPVAASISDVPVPMVTQKTLDSFSIVIGTQDPANGILGLVVSDCSSPYKGVIGATIVVKENGTAVGDDPFDVGGLLGDSAAGTYLVANVPPGNATITVTYAGMTFLANDVIIEANAETGAQIRPGY